MRGQPWPTQPILLTGQGAFPTCRCFVSRDAAVPPASSGFASPVCECGGRCEARLSQRPDAAPRPPRPPPRRPRRPRRGLHRRGEGGLDGEDLSRHPRPRLAHLQPLPSGEVHSLHLRPGLTPQQHRKFLPFPHLVDDRESSGSSFAVAVLNKRLNDVANNTPCHCQRKSQCVTDDSKVSPTNLHPRKAIPSGSIHLVTGTDDLPRLRRVRGPRQARGALHPRSLRRVQLPIASRGGWEECGDWCRVLLERADRFSRTLRGRWALGDCGNSALVFIWTAHKRLHISTGRQTEHYLTQREVKILLGQSRRPTNVALLRWPT